MKSAQEQARINRVADKLNNAKRIALTAEECRIFEAFNRGLCFPDSLHKVIAQVSERTGIPLSSGRVAFDSVGKSLLVVD